MMRKTLVLIMVVLLSVGVSHAQDVAAELVFPPAVSQVSGEITFIGTANDPAQSNYFVEARQLEVVESVGLPNAEPGTTLNLLGEAGFVFAPPSTETPWFPATLPTNNRVVNGPLGVWDTRTVPDGLYALRLTVNRTGGGPVFDVVGPVRVQNTPIPGVTQQLDTDPDIAEALVQLTAQATVPAQPGSTADGAPTLIPTPTALNEDDVVATALVRSNVRAGDGTRFAQVGFLETGETAVVLGRSSYGTGWLNIRLEDGTEGWVAPSVIDVSGNVLSLPQVEPPVTPTPPASPTPVLPDGQIVNIRVDREIREGDAFQIIVDVRNNGGPTLDENIVFCNVEPMNAETSTLIDPLNGGQQRSIALPIRIDEQGDQNIRIICKVDMLDALPEASENNNISDFTLYFPDDDDDE